MSTDLKSLDELALERFCELLRIRTIAADHPNYEAVHLFLQRAAGELGLAFRRIDMQLSDQLSRPLFLLSLIGNLIFNMLDFYFQLGSIFLI